MKPNIIFNFYNRAFPDGSDGVNLFCSDQKTILETIPPTELHSILSTCEHTRLNSFKRDRIKKQFLAGRLFLRFILSKYLDCSPSDVDILVTSEGKPYLSQKRQLYFNLSHSGDRYALAITNMGEIGVDVEQIKQRRNLGRLAEAIFTDREQRLYQALSNTKKSESFYRSWALKEATLKAHGAGLTIPVNSIGFDHTNPNQWNSSLGDVEKWSFWHNTFSGYSYAIAVDHSCTK